ncbi:protein DpdG [Mesorhizobium sp. M1027]|uniref:protein DpdG n=1 Tax=Mesorhizobium sp. M1027 TaxID=2957050 RepID=UPI00333C6EDB
MTVLNQASDGQVNTLITLVRASVRFGPRSRGDLLAMCGSDLEIVEKSKLNGSFLRWLELGLFETVDDLTALREPYRSRLGSDVSKVETLLPAVAREIALLTENNARFWEQEGSRSADLSRGLSWMLAQDVYTLDTSNHAAIQALEAVQVKDPQKRMLQNDTRYNTLKSWMTYLGFSREGPLFVVDPTEALRGVLDDVFDSNAPLPARAFLAKIADILPVLDTGLYRARVEETLKDSTWEPAAEGVLSTSLSRAIERLVDAAELEFEQRDDNEEGLQMTGFGGRRWRSFPYIRRGPARTGAA